MKYLVLIGDGMSDYHNAKRFILKHILKIKLDI